MTTQATARDFDLIRYPLNTEQTTAMRDNLNTYVFVVDKKATKPEIKAAFERIFGVKVVSVNTMIVKGQNTGFRGIPGKHSDFKKAIVRLEAGSKIDLEVGV
jgi:large subunit ribosomal protein L23